MNRGMVRSISSDGGPDYEIPFAEAREQVRKGNATWCDGRSSILRTPDVRKTGNLRVRKSGPRVKIDNETSVRTGPFVWQLV